MITDPYDQDCVISSVSKTLKLISVARQISDISIIDKRTPIAVLSCDINCQIIGDLLNNQAQITEHAASFITMKSGVVVASSKPWASVLAMKHFLSYQYASPGGNFVITTRIPLSDLSSSIYSVVFSLLLILAVFFFICIFISVIISTFLTKPLSVLSATIKKVSAGDLDVRVPVIHEEELQLLGTQMNKMLDDIARLIKENYMISYSEKEAQLKALQSQINPHFLYNALNTINCKIMESTTNDDRDTLTRSINNLGELLRYSFKNMQRLAPLCEDIQQVRNYLSIQSLRFPNRFKAIIWIDDKVEQMMIMRLLIQPLVENSIIHGFKDKQFDCLLVVTAYQKEGKLIIKVYDNGCGLPTGFDITKEDFKASIGLKNVNDRIILKYGPDFPLRFKSKIGKFTQVTITIPCEEKTREF